VLNLPLKYNTYWSTEDGQPTVKPITTIETSDIEIPKSIEEDFFKRPSRRKLIEGL